MQLYSSKSQQQQELKPHNNQVTLYVCGITPYDTTHLGHAFTYVSFDVLIRYLEWQGVNVRYVQNVTDIDDDVLRKAKQVGKNWIALGDEWTIHFIDDLCTINVRPPDEYPRATEVIAEIVQMDQALIKHGVAYESNGSVYFDVNAFKSFGELSHIPRAEMLPVANERGNRPDDPDKHNPLDFVLWQRKAEGEPAWPSPWGEGRPGWHIECSTMSTKFLGQTIDIHGGGADLVFPHHECEIAQTESATGISPFVRIWMHTAMVRHEGEKMSKSLGNLVMVRDLLHQYAPDAIRLYLSRHHYRTTWEYSAPELDASAAMAQRWHRASKASTSTAHLNGIVGAFKQAMDDDLDTPRAIKIIDDLANGILNGQYSANDKPVAQATLQELAGVLGLQLGTGVSKGVVGGWKKHRQKFSAEQ